MVLLPALLLLFLGMGWLSTMVCLIPVLDLQMSGTWGGLVGCFLVQDTVVHGWSSLLVLVV